MNFVRNGYKEVTVDDFFGSFAELALFRGNVQKGKPRVLQGVPFNFLSGDPNTAAIYHSCETEEKPEVLENLTWDEFDDCLLEKRVKVNGLLSHVVDNFSAKPAFIRSLKAFSSAVDVYEGMEGASITMKILTEPLYQARWIPGSADEIRIGNEREVTTTLHKQGKCQCKPFWRTNINDQQMLKV